MCFSNLPIEFDDEGNPYLAAEADEVSGIGDPAQVRPEGEPLGEADPETLYDDILEQMPPRDRERVRMDTRRDDSHKQATEGD